MVYKKVRANAGPEPSITEKNVQFVNLWYRWSESRHTIAFYLAKF